MLRASGVSEKGHVRPTNEDCYAIDEPARLCVVADGLGGHNAGGVAARIAVDAVVAYVRDAARTGRVVSMPHDEDPDRIAPPGCSTARWPFGYDPGLSSTGNLLRTAVYLAHLQVVEAAATIDAYAGMGTTLVATLVTDQHLAVAHAGDSRLYMLTGGRLRQVTDDDSWMATMLAGDPRVDPVALRYHPMRNVLTNAVGAGIRTDVHVTEEQLVGGEWLLLSTDGVHGVLDERLIAKILGDADDPADAADQLVVSALARGSRDNCTAIVARFRP